LSVTLLLALLGLLVQGVLSSLEIKIKENVKESGVRNVVLTHRVPSVAYRDDVVFTDSIKNVMGSRATVKALHRLNTAAYRGASKTTIPVISYNPDEWTSLGLPFSVNQCYFFSYKPDFTEPVLLNLRQSGRNIKLTALNCTVPNELQRSVNLDQFLLLPIHVTRNLERSGYQSFKIVQVHDLSDLFYICKQFEAWFRMDRRNIQIVDQRDLLERLDELYKIQSQWRIGVGVMVSIVLIFLIGSTSLLEFRQNQYVIALLKSFGVSSYLVAIAFLLENLVLVSLGLFSAAGIMLGLNSQALNKLSSNLSIEAIEWVLNTDDLYVLAVACGIGVVLALIPVFKSLGRPVGRILQ